MYHKQHHNAVVDAVMHTINGTPRPTFQRSTNTDLTRSTNMCLDHTRWNGGMYTTLGDLNYLKGESASGPHNYERDSVPENCSREGWDRPCAKAYREQAKDAFTNKLMGKSDDFRKKAVVAARGYDNAVQRELDEPPPENCSEEDWKSDPVMLFRNPEAYARIAHDLSKVTEMHKRAIFAAYLHGICHRPGDCSSDAWDSVLALRKTAISALHNNDMKQVFDLQRRAVCEAEQYDSNMTRSTNMCLDHTRRTGGMYTDLGILDYFKGGKNPISAADLKEQQKAKWQHEFDDAMDKMIKLGKCVVKSGECSNEAWSSLEVIEVNTRYAKAAADHDSPNFRYTVKKLLAKQYDIQHGCRAYKSN